MKIKNLPQVQLLAMVSTIAVLQALFLFGAILELSPASRVGIWLFSMLMIVFAFYTGRVFLEKRTLENDLKKTRIDYRLYKNSIDDVAITAIVDVDGRIIEVNDTFCSVSQFSKNELIGKTWSLLNSGTHDRIFWDDLWSTVRVGKSWQGEICNRRKDGQYFWVDTSIFPSLDLNGRPTKYIVFSYDITKRKKVENALRSVVTSLDEVIFVVDKNFKFVNVWTSNPTALFMPPGEFSGKTLKTVFGEENSEKMIPVIESVLNSGKPELVDYTNIEGNRWYTAKVNLILDQGARANQVSMAVRETTQLRKMRLELDQQRLRANQASKMAALGEMAGGLAHEINNPLAIMMGKVAIIKMAISKDSLDKALVTEHLVKMEQTIKRIAAIIKGLKSFSRNGDRDPVSPVGMKEVMEDTMALCRERFKSAGIQLKYNVNEDQVVVCRGVQISQIILNLINNSFEEVSKLSGDRWVEVTSAENGDHFDIQVTDCGKGIPPEVLEKIWQPFFTTKEVGVGTGLGLSISLGLARDNGGDLLYDNQCPNTRFILRLKKHKANTSAA